MPTRPKEICSSYRFAVTHHQCTATLAKGNPHCPVVLCKSGSQQGCVSALQHWPKATLSATMQISSEILRYWACTHTLLGNLICCSYRCAVTLHHCTAALFRANCIHHYTLLLCKPGSQQAPCHCNYTYGDLPFIQVCSDQAPINCSTVQGKMHSPLRSAAVQARLTAGTGSL